MVFGIPYTPARLRRAKCLPDVALCPQTGRELRKDLIMFYETHECEQDSFGGRGWNLGLHAHAHQRTNYSKARSDIPNEGIEPMT